MKVDFKSYLTFSPVVYHQKVEQDVEGTDEIVEVVGPVVILRKICVQYQIRQLIGGVPGHHPSVEFHSQGGKEVHYKE